MIDLNQAVAVAMSLGPVEALHQVDEIAVRGELCGPHLLPTVRGELLFRLGLTTEAISEWETATQMCTNPIERAVLSQRRSSAPSPRMRLGPAGGHIRLHIKWQPVRSCTGTH